jgi:hypothetical protein
VSTNPIFEFKGLDERSKEMDEIYAKRLVDASNFCFFLNGLISEDDIRRFLIAQPIHRVLHIASIFELKELPEEGGKEPLVEKIISLVTSPCFPQNNETSIDDDKEK